MTYMYNKMKEQFITLLSKYEAALSDFKRKRRYAYINDEDYVEYNLHINRLNDMISVIKSRLTDIESQENAKRVSALIEEYENISDVRQELLQSIRKELENIDKGKWYAENFDDWKTMPERQECEDYPIVDRLHYSRCRLEMFNHLEDIWKKETFPTLAHRLEFF